MHEQNGGHDTIALTINKALKKIVLYAPIMIRKAKNAREIIGTDLEALTTKVAATLV